jgi:eukaryotic-like serine/threonine-protein kinase
MTSGSDRGSERAHPPVDDTEPVAGRYALEEAIGAGSASIVYRGRDLDTGDAVAVKVFRADGTPSDLRQQRREMAALARLRHPGLVTLIDGGTEPGPAGRLYVITDLVEGPTLAARIRLGPLDADAVRDLGVRLAGALAAVHAGGYVHRDVKPANVLLGDGSRPRLADFGIARAFDGTVATAAGRIVGTAAYLSPEQVRGGEIGPPVDVYALGLVLLECLTGRREYPGMAAEALTARLHRRPEVPDGLPWGLTDVITVMTADDPAHRPTAAAVASALGSAAPAAVTSTGGLATPASAPVVALRGRGRVAALVAAAAVLLAVPIAGLDGFGAPPAAPASEPAPLPAAEAAAPAAPSVPQQQAVAEAPAALARVVPAAQPEPLRADTPDRRSGGARSRPAGGSGGGGQAATKQGDGKGKDQTEGAKGKQDDGKHGGDGSGKGGGDGHGGD